MSEIHEEQVMTEQPAVEEFDYYKYQPKDDEGNSIGPEQTIKYPKGDWSAAMEIMAKNHSESIRSAIKLKQDLVLGKIQTETPAEERMDYSRREFTPRELTDDERWTISQHPESPEARKLIFESELGATPEVIRNTLQEASNDLREWRARAEAEAFMADTPEWQQYRTLENGVKLCDYILTSRRKPTKANYSWAFKQLKESLLIQPVPTVTEVTPPSAEEKVENEPILVQTPVTTQPVLTSSGLNRRNSSSSGTPVMTREKWTVEQVNKMSGTEYAKHMRDKSFVEFVEKNTHLLD